MHITIKDSTSGFVKIMRWIFALLLGVSILAAVTQVVSSYTLVYFTQQTFAYAQSADAQRHTIASVVGAEGDSNTSNTQETIVVTLAQDVTISSR